jgi:hypothetical protein
MSKGQVNKRKLILSRASFDLLNQGLERKKGVATPRVKNPR